MRPLEMVFAWPPFRWLCVLVATLATWIGAQREPPPSADPVTVVHPEVIERMTGSSHPVKPAPPDSKDCSKDTFPDRRLRRAHAASWFRALPQTQRHRLLEACGLHASAPCAGLIPMPRRTHTFEDRIGTLSRTCAAEHCRAVNAALGSCNTPLVVAFDAQVVEYTDGDEPFEFAPGVPVTSDWPTARTPWIALDRDGDGAITSGAELFGSATTLSDGTTATNGFSALAALDANRDGTIDRDDPAFGSLLLWSDRDADRTSTPSELRPLASLITAIPLGHQLEPRCTARGACEGERGIVHWRDALGAARAGAVIDIYLPSRGSP